MMKNYKDYISTQLNQNMKCSCCGYKVLAGSTMWLVPFPKTDGALCSPCWDNKRHDRECANDLGGKENE